MLSHAFSSWVLPFFGFFLLPWTTLAYAVLWDWSSHHHLSAFAWFFVALAFLVDVASFMGSRTARIRRSSGATY